MNKHNYNFEFNEKQDIQMDKKIQETVSPLYPEILKISSKENAEK